MKTDNIAITRLQRHLKEKEYYQVIEIATTMLEHKADAEVYYILGIAHAHTGKTKMAFENFKKAISLSKDFHSGASAALISAGLELEENESALLLTEYCLRNKKLRSEMEEMIALNYMTVLSEGTLKKAELGPLINKMLKKYGYKDGSGNQNRKLRQVLKEWNELIDFVRTSGEDIYRKGIAKGFTP